MLIRKNIKTIIFTLLLIILFNNQIKANPSLCQTGFALSLASVISAFPLGCALTTLLHYNREVQNVCSISQTSNLADDPSALTSLIRKRRIAAAITGLTGIVELSLFVTGMSLLFIC